MTGIKMKSIKTNIILFTVLFTLVVTLVIASFSFITFQSYLKKNMVQQTEFSLLQIMDGITTDLQELVYLSKWCGSNRTITTYLESSGVASSKTTLEAYERLREEQINSKISEYIERIIISNNQGKYIQVLGSVTEFYVADPATVRSQTFFEPLLSDQKLTWIGIIEDPLIKSHPEKIIPVIRPIYSTYGSSVIGWGYITISSEMITDKFRNYNIPDDCIINITIADNTYQMKDGDIYPVSFHYDTQKVIANAAQSKGTKVLEIKMEDGRERTLISTSNNKYGWHLSQTLSEKELSGQRTIYYMLIFFICFLIIVLGVLLIIYLNHIINTPIEKIRHKINEISSGDFSYDSTIEWDNEFGDIGKGINILSYDITNLMDKRIAYEKQRNELEYQIRLSQINPHFLYNTLNSIKWMATIQNADGIASIVSALAGLLRKVSKDNKTNITIREELATLGDYFLILKYRYGGNIILNYQVEAEDLYDCQILTFSLQPIVENAIFHGIEPKGSGRIDINIRHHQASDVLIEIIDDGVGMTEEQILKTLSATDDTSSSFFKKIGIANVNSRIRYTYGEQYGLSITSEPGTYTKVTIIIPNQKSSS